MRRMLSKLAMVGMLAALAWPATAQERRPGAGGRGGSRPPAASRPGTLRERLREHGGPIGLLGPSAELFRPAPEDLGPLADGEEEQLLAFAGEHAPRLAMALKNFKERDPERFHQRLQQIAPRLRHLKRVFEENPQVGELMRQHAENMMEIERLAASVRKAAPDAPDAQRDRQALRERLAESVHYESQALDTLAKHLQSARRTKVDALMARLTDPNANVSALPPKARELVQEYRQATTDAARTAALGQLRAGVEQRFDEEVRALERRAELIRSRAPQEVDQRFEHTVGRAAASRPAP